MKQVTKMLSKCSSYLMILPAFLVFTIFAVFPLLQTAYYSFTDWDGIQGAANFVGLGNYLTIFAEPPFYKAILVTFEFTAITLVFQQIIAIFIAMMVRKSNRRNNLFRTIFYIPSLLTTVAIGLIFSYVFNVNFGVFNHLCAAFGLENLANFDWLGNSRSAIVICAVVAIWQYAGYNMMIYVGQLNSISSEYYESAVIDGATPWKQFSRITLPLLAPAITVNTLVTLIGGLKQFDIPYVLTNGGPGDASQTVTMLLFKDAFYGNKAGYSAAESVILMIIVLLFSILQTRYSTQQEVEL